MLRKSETAYIKLTVGVPVMGAGVKDTVLSELTKIAMQACWYFFEVSSL